MGLLATAKREVKQTKVVSSVAVHFYFCGIPSGSDRIEACTAGDLASVPGSGRSSGEGNGYPLQSSCLENPMDRGTWRAIVHRVAKKRVGHD